VVHVGHVDADHPAAGRGDAQAEVDVVAVEVVREGLAEAQRPDDPRRDRQQRPVDDLDLVRAGRVVRVEHRRRGAPEQLVGRVPPLQRHAPAAEQPDDADTRLGEQRPRPPQQRVVEQLEILMDEHERLEVVSRGGLVHHLVVGLLDRVAAVTGEDRGVRLGHALDAAHGARLEQRLVGHGGAEDDHRAMVVHAPRWRSGIILPPMPGRPRVCLVSASGQNVFFAEILDALGSALREEGIAVEEAVDHFPPPSDDLVYLFVPHEYHPMVHEAVHPSQTQLRRSIALCTEQPGTSWFETTAAIAAEAGTAIDINALGTRELVRRGIDAEHVPLGYVPAWDSWQGGEHERPVDLAFLGAHTERRGRVLARCAPALADRRAAIHLVETVHPHLAGSGYFLSYDAKWRLLKDTKVLLNVHHGPLAYMEWHRVLGAAINGCVVLSEHSVGTEPFEPGVHYLSAGCDDLPRVLDGLLADPTVLRRIRHAAYDLLRERMPMSAAVDVVLRAVERVASARVPAAERAAPAPPPMPKPPPPRGPEAPEHAAVRAAGVGGPGRPVRDPAGGAAAGVGAVEELGPRRDDATAAAADAVEELGPRRDDAKAAAADAADAVEELGPRRDDAKVSVLLTTAGAAAGAVADALRSVALSDLREVEVVTVVDDPAAARAACRDLPWLTVRLAPSPGGGVAAARNLALAHARADLVFVLDADHAVLPRGLGLLASTLDEHPDAAFAYGIVQVSDSSGPSGVIDWLDWDPRRLRYGSYVDATAMIRRSALRAVGGYSTDAALSGSEDFAVWIALADAGMTGIRLPDFVAIGGSSRQ